MTSSNMLYAMYLAAPELFDRRLENEPRWHQDPGSPSPRRHREEPQATKQSRLLSPNPFGSRNDGLGVAFRNALRALAAAFKR